MAEGKVKVNTQGTNTTEVVFTDHRVSIPGDQYLKLSDGYQKYQECKDDILVGEQDDLTKIVRDYIKRKHPDYPVEVARVLLRWDFTNHKKNG
jgi:hypothetical protein